MSRENVHIVRELSNAFLRGDEAAWLGFYAQDSHLHMPSGRLNDAHAVYVGVDGLRRAVAEHEEVFDDSTADARQTTRGSASRWLGSIACATARSCPRGATSPGTPPWNP
jgi:hypothetical protein